MMKLIVPMQLFIRNNSLFFLILLAFFATSNFAFSQTRNTVNSTTGQGGTTQQEGIDLSAGSSENIQRDFNSGFVGGSDNAGRFIGNESAAQQSLNGQATPNFQRAERNQAAQSQRSIASPIRVQARIAFQFPQRKTVTLNTGLSSELIRLQNLKPEYTSVRLNRSNDGAWVLSGSVPTRRDRKLIEFFINLEPGVKSIRNDLQVTPGMSTR